MSNEKPKRKYNPKDNTTPAQSAERRTKRSRELRERRAQRVAPFGFTSYDKAAAALVGALGTPGKPIKLVTPLPCSVRGCEHSATRATANPVDDEGVAGLWIIHPICDNCLHLLTDLADATPAPSSSPAP